MELDVVEIVRAKLFAKLENVSLSVWLEVVELACSVVVASVLLSGVSGLKKDVEIVEAVDAAILVSSGDDDDTGTLLMVRTIAELECGVDTALDCPRTIVRKPYNR